MLKKLLDAKLYATLSKCEFHKTSLDYLGYRVSCNGVEVDLGKVKSILDWQAPRPISSYKDPQCISFLCLDNGMPSGIQEAKETVCG